MRSTTNTGAFHGNSFHNTTFNGSHNGSWNGSGWHGNGWHGGWNNGWHGGWHGGWYGGWHGGCWGCGFGWGFGWGFGFGWGWGWGGWWGPGWGFWGPSYPWWGYPAYSYPYPVYPNYNVTYPPPYSGTSADNDSSSNVSPSDDYFARPSFGGSLDADAQGSPNTNAITGNVANSTPTVLVYLKDGTMYTASDYWLADGKLHYVTSYSTESIVDMDEVDLQRSVDENAKRGVTFTLKATRNGPGGTPTTSPESTPEPQVQDTSTTQT